MKKILTAALVAAMLLCVATGALAATGLGSVTEVSNTAATAEKDGSVSSYTFMCALSLDAEGKIESVTFDALQTKGTFNTAGEITCDAAKFLFALIIVIAKHCQSTYKLHNTCLWIHQNLP